MSRFLKMLLVLVILGSTSTFSLWAADVEPTAEQLKALTLQLGEDSFEKRQEAEKELVKIGLKAKDALTTATLSRDAQIATTSKKLLTKLKFSTLGQMDYFDILPEKCLIAGRFYNLTESWKNMQNTALAKLLLSKNFESLRADLTQKIDNNGGVLALCKHFQGQIAGGLWEFNPMAGSDGIKGALIAEITDDNPQDILNKLMEIFKSIGTYHEVELFETGEGTSIVCVIGKHLIAASNEDAAKLILDGFIAATPKGFNSTAAFVKTKAALVAKSDVTISVDFMGLIKPILPMIGQGVAGFDEVLKAAGYENVKLITYSSAVIGDSFEERFVAVTDGPFTGLMSVYSPSPDGDVREAFNIIPANAIAGFTQYVDGAKNAKAFEDYITAVKGMEAAGNTLGGDAAGKTGIAEVEAKLGIKFSDLYATLKGSSAAWVVLAPPPSLSAPDIGGYIPFADAAKAKSTLETLVQSANKITGKEVIKTVPYKTYTLYQTDLLAIDESAKNFPYPTPCMAIVGNRIFVASSSSALQKQLNNLENKAPGLAASPEFIKNTASLKADEFKGTLYYVDLKSLLVFGGNAGLPILAGTIHDETLNKLLAGLPPSAELFKDITPMLVTLTQPANDLMMVSIHTPLPIVMTYAGAVGVLVAIQLSAMGIE